MVEGEQMVPETQGRAVDFIAVLLGTLEWWALPFGGLYKLRNVEIDPHRRG